jgi:hypothetical protein
MTSPEIKDAFDPGFEDQFRETNPDWLVVGCEDIGWDRLGTLELEFYVPGRYGVELSFLPLSAVAVRPRTVLFWHDGRRPNSTNRFTHMSNLRAAPIALVDVDSEEALLEAIRPAMQQWDEPRREVINRGYVRHFKARMGSAPNVSMKVGVGRMNSLLRLNPARLPVAHALHDYVVEHAGDVDEDYRH